MADGRTSTGVPARRRLEAYATKALRSRLRPLTPRGCPVAGRCDPAGEQGTSRGRRVPGLFARPSSFPQAVAELLDVLQAVVRRGSRVNLRHHTGQRNRSRSWIQVASPHIRSLKAGRYLRPSPATLRSWFLGSPYPKTKGRQFALVLNLAKRARATFLLEPDRGSCPSVAPDRARCSARRGPPGARVCSARAEHRPATAAGRAPHRRRKTVRRPVRSARDASGPGRSRWELANQPTRSRPGRSPFSVLEDPSRSPGHTRLGSRVHAFGDAVHGLGNGFRIMPRDVLVDGVSED